MENSEAHVSELPDEEPMIGVEDGSDNNVTQERPDAESSNNVLGRQHLKFKCNYFPCWRCRQLFRLEYISLEPLLLCPRCYYWDNDAKLWAKFEDRKKLNLAIMDFAKSFKQNIDDEKTVPDSAEFQTDGLESKQFYVDMILYRASHGFYTSLIEFMQEIQTTVQNLTNATDPVSEHRVLATKFADHLKEKAMELYKQLNKSEKKNKDRERSYDVANYVQLKYGYAKCSKVTSFKRSLCLCSKRSDGTLDDTCTYALDRFPELQRNNTAASNGLGEKRDLLLPVIIPPGRVKPSNSSELLTYFPEMGRYPDPFWNFLLSISQLKPSKKYIKQESIFVQADDEESSCSTCCENKKPSFKREARLCKRPKSVSKPKIRQVKSELTNDRYLDYLVSKNEELDYAWREHDKATKRMRTDLDTWTRRLNMQTAAIKRDEKVQRRVDALQRATRRKKVASRSRHLCDLCHRRVVEFEHVCHESLCLADFASIKSNEKRFYCSERCCLQDGHYRHCAWAMKACLFEQCTIEIICTENNPILFNTIQVLRIRNINEENKGRSM